MNQFLCVVIVFRPASSKRKIREISQKRELKKSKNRNDNFDDLTNPAID
jgi:hypothetical protein